MPKITEIREIDGEIWCRVGKTGDFPSGIALYTPDEVTWLKRDAVNAYMLEQGEESAK